MERRLATILAADVVGFSRLMAKDEEGTLADLKAHRDIIDAQVGQHAGRIFGGAGDSLIVEFASPVQATRCAVALQNGIAARNADQSDAAQMCFRIGIHLGDVIADGDNLMGDGVNIAARLETLAPPGGICISKTVADQIAGKVEAEFASAGSHKLRNIPTRVEVWTWPADLAQKPPGRPGSKRLAIALAGLVAGLSATAYFTFTSGNQSDFPTGARIVIVPFENVGNDPQDAYFADGLTRDLNALLSKFSNLFVIAPEAATALRDEADCKEFRDELAADYILNGAVQRSDDKLRVTTTFTDAQTCRQLTPPGPFDMDLSIANVLDIQIDIARKVAAQIGSSDAPLFNAAIQQTIREQAPENLEAYECYLLGFWFYQTFSLEAHRRARECLLRTVREEPGYSQGWSRLAFNYLESKKRSFDTPDDWAELARDAATRALEEDRDNPDAHYALAILSRMTGEAKAVFFEHAQTAIDLNPNDSWILADLGIFLAYSGEFETGKDWISRARELNPKLHPGYGNALVLHGILQGDYDLAQNTLLSMGAPTSAMSLTSLTASYALDGEQAKAEEMAAMLRDRHPGALADPRAPYRARGMPPELIEKIMRGVRLAGIDVPEENRDN